MELEQLAKSEADQLRSELSALAHKHAHVSFALIGALVLALGMMCFGGYLAVKHFDKQEARAEAQYQAYIEHDKQTQEQLRNDAQMIANLSAQQAQKTVVIHETDKKADAKIADVTRPDKTQEQVAGDVLNAYHFNAVGIDPSGLTLSFTLPQVQTFTATKIDRDRYFEDYQNEKQIADLKQTVIDLQKKDNDRLVADNAEGKKALEAERKLNHKTKFKKFLDGSRRVGEDLGVAVLTYFVVKKL